MKDIHSRLFEKQREALIKADQKSEQVNQKPREELRAGQLKHKEKLRGQSKHRGVKSRSIKTQGGIKSWSI
jgi:hypothetical protein